MTKEERKLVIEYLRAKNILRYYIRNTNSEVFINAHFDTLNFKLYALRVKWNELWRNVFKAIGL